MRKQRHYRKQIRLLRYDYSQDGYYFVTICTQNRGNFFGEIKNGIMRLSNIGYIATKFWQKIPNHFNNIKLDEWIVMPNHMHGVIIIDKSNHPVGVQNFEPLQVNRYQHIIPKSLSSIIRAYKAAVTMWCNQNQHQNFKWQRSFYDHIIRNSESLDRICEYIRYNPMQWSEDVENLKNGLSKKEIQKHYDYLLKK